MRRISSGDCITHCGERGDDVMATSSIESRTLPQQIQAHLIDLIADGILRPGEPLRMESLCEEYGFTQTPLREALRSLASQGLVEYVPNRGYRVPQTGIEELKHIFQVREYLEGLAARLLATRATQEQLAQLGTLAVECDEIEDTERASAHSVSRELEFHRLIVQWCGNGLIRKLLLGPNILLRMLLLGSGFDVQRGGLEFDHRAVVRAIACGDPEQAESAMRSHIREGAELTLDALRNSISSETGEQEVRSG